MVILAVHVLAVNVSLPPSPYYFMSKVSYTLLIVLKVIKRCVIHSRVLYTLSVLF